MALFEQIETQIREKGPQSARQLAEALDISESALAPMLTLLVSKGRLAERLADLRLKRGVAPTPYYMLGRGERLHINLID